MVGAPRLKAVRSTRLARPMVNEDAWPALFRRTLGLSPVLCLRELKLASSGAACEGTLPPLGSQ